MPENGQLEVPLLVETWKRDSGSDGRRSRDLSIFSRDRGLDGKPRAWQNRAFICPIGINVIKEVCSDLPQLWANRGQTPSTRLSGSRRTIRCAELSSDLLFSQAVAGSDFFASGFQCLAVRILAEPE
jgi:hypothetical protein